MSEPPELTPVIGALRVLLRSAKIAALITRERNLRWRSSRVGLRLQRMSRSYMRERPAAT